MMNILKRRNILRCFISILMIASFCISMASVGMANEAGDNIEFTVFANQKRTVESLEENRFTEYMEEKTGVKINWIPYIDDIATQYNLSIAGGEYPDIYI